MMTTAYKKPMIAAVTALLALPQSWALEVRKYNRDQLVCAAWDVHVTTLIEDFGSYGLIASEALYAAALQQLRARGLCQEGREREAYRIYERIALPPCNQTYCSPDEPNYASMKPLD
jgi:hypothetical protein